MLGVAVWRCRGFDWRSFVDGVAVGLAVDGARRRKDKPADAEFGHQFEQIDEYVQVEIKNGKYKKSNEKLSEKSKELNPIEWTKLMNNYKNMAEEIVLNEYVFV